MGEPRSCTRSSIQKFSPLGLSYLNLLLLAQCKFEGLKPIIDDVILTVGSSRASLLFHGENDQKGKFASSVSRLSLQCIRLASHQPFMSVERTISGGTASWQSKAHGVRDDSGKEHSKAWCMVKGAADSLLQAHESARSTSHHSKSPDSIVYVLAHD